MFAVELKGVSNAKGVGNAWFAAVRDATARAATGMAKIAFKRVLYTSPQYSGAFVANWKMNVGTPDLSWDTDPLGTKGKQPAPFQIGSNPAIQHAMSSEAGKLQGFILGQSIYISNSTTGFSGVEREAVKRDGVERDAFSATAISPLAVKIEEGKIKLRDVNVGASRMAARAGEEVLRKFSTIGGAQLATLMKASMV